MKWKMKKTMGVFVFQKYGKFWSVLLGYFIKHKPLISEAWTNLSKIKIENHILIAHIYNFFFFFSRIIYSQVVFVPGNMVPGPDITMMKILMFAQQLVWPQHQIVKVLQICPLLFRPRVRFLSPITAKQVQ